MLQCIAMDAGCWILCHAMRYNGFRDAFIIAILKDTVRKYIVVRVLVGVLITRMVVGVGAGV